MLVAKSEAVQRSHRTIEPVHLGRHWTLAEQAECHCRFLLFSSYLKRGNHLRYAFSILTCSGEVKRV